MEEQTKKKGNRPDMRVVQVVLDEEQKEKFVNVGAMWKATSKKGNAFFNMKIGDLRLLVFPNED